jgi:methyl-accepting chemotaxis protein
MRRRLQLKVVLLVAATFAIALVANTWFVLREFEIQYRTALLGKLDVVAADLGQKLASGLALGLRLEELPDVGAEARGLLAPYPEIGYAVVVNAGGTAVHGSLPPAELASLGQALARVRAAGAREGGSPVDWQGREYVDVSVPVRSAEAGRPQVGAIRLGLRGDVIEHQLHDIWIGAFVVGALVLAAAVVLVVLLVSSAVTRPVFELVRAAEQIAGGDLTQRAAERGRDELAALGRAFNRMAERLQGLLRRIDGASAQVAQASDSISGSSRAVLGSAEAQAGSVDEASRSVGIMNRSVLEILASIDRLTHASQGSSSSILEMGATIEEVASNMEFLASSVE